MANPLSSLNWESNAKQPQKAKELIESILPDIIPFYRTPISSPEPKTRLEDVAIYGSVSVVDIAEKVRIALGATDEGARVVIEPEDIKIMDNEGRGAEAEGDRIKVLGDFAVEIRVKNGVEVRRIVRISAQERLWNLWPNHMKVAFRGQKSFPSGLCPSIILRPTSPHTPVEKLFDSINPPLKFLQVEPIRQILSHPFFIVTSPQTFLSSRPYQQDGGCCSKSKDGRHRWRRCSEAV